MSELTQAPANMPDDKSQYMAQLQNAIKEILPVDQMKAMVPEGIDPKLIGANFFRAVADNPKLMACSPVSLARCLAECATMGLWPGPQKHMHLVPYKGVATPIVGYQGLIALMVRDAGVSHVRSNVVYEEDEFIWEEGLNPRLEHTPSMAAKTAIGAYAVAHFADGNTMAVVMRHVEIEAIRAKTPGKGGDVWRDHWDEMAKKTAIRRLAKAVAAVSGTVRSALDNIEAQEMPKPVAPQPRNVLENARRYSDG